MKQRCSLAALFLVLALALVPGPAAAATQRRFALLVGNDLGGPDTRPLLFASQDARRLHDVLTQLGGVRSGDAELWVDRVRQADFPVEDFDQLNKLELCYQTFEYPIVVHMFAQNRSATEREITYDYQEAADGSGTLFFNLTTDGTADAIDLRFISRWLGSGAGRADAYAVNRNNLLAGTDCWGPDTRAAMSWRWPAEKSSDEPSLCAFSAPTNLAGPTCGP